MSAASVLDEFLDPLSRCLDAESARRIAAWDIAPSLQQRIDVLAERANEGSLNEDDRAEYETLINAADVVSVLKLKARKQVAEIPFP